MLILVDCDYVVAIPGSSVNTDVLSYNYSLNMKKVVPLKNFEVPPGSIAGKAYAGTQKSRYVIYVFDADYVYPISSKDTRIYADGEDLHSFRSLVSDVRAKVLDVYPVNGSTINSFSIVVRVYTSEAVYHVVGVIDGSKEIVFSKGKGNAWSASIKLDEGGHSLIVKAYGVFR